MIKKFGSLNGRDVLKAVLSDGDVSLSILNYGAVTQDWRVPLGGARVPVVLGFEAFEDYLEHSEYFGIIAGRLANRTASGRFEIDGMPYQLSVNEPPHHLHGGFTGLGRRLWDLEARGSKSVRLSYRSPDGEEGYPGAVDFSVVISLDGNTVTYEMSAVPDRVTPINLAQHSYYSLGEASVRDHHLTLAAPYYTPTDKALIPTGEIKSVAGTRFDFREGAVMGRLDQSAQGLDMNMVLEEGRDPQTPVARVRSPNGLCLKLWTDQPGLQIYNAPKMHIPVPGLDGQTYGPFSGLCLEAQNFPDAVNHPQFPSAMFSPERPYQQTLKVEIG